MQSPISSRRKTPSRLDNHIGDKTHHSNPCYWNRLGELRAHIPLYKARCPTYEHVLAKHIINLDFTFIAAKTKYFSSHPPAAHPLALHPFAPRIPETNLPTLQPIQFNDMAGILSERPRQVQNLYWQPGQPIGVPIRNFRQIRYLFLPYAVPDLEQALYEARIDCVRDSHKQLIEFGRAAKVWITVHGEYEPVNPLTNKQPFEQYLNASPTRMYKRDGTISAFGNPYIDSITILKDRISEFNAKFISNKSGLRPTRMLQFNFKMVKYASLEGRGWQLLPDFLSKKKAVINIQNEKERCFGYSLLFVSNANDFQNSGDIERLFIKNRCSSTTISILFFTQYHLTISINTRIISKWTLMYSRLLMTKSEIGIPWW